MFTFFSRQGRARKRQAAALYKAAALAARKPEFYRDFGVPDSFDGRFEMLCLHIWLVMRRLHAEGQEKLAQNLFDTMFKTMEQTIREIGVGDLSVPRHMKKMMTGFNGRASAYEAAMRGQEKLEDVLVRNVYGTVDGIEPDKLAALAEYVRKAALEPPEMEEQNVAQT